MLRKLDNFTWEGIHLTTKGQILEMFYVKLNFLCRLLNTISVSAHSTFRMDLLRTGFYSFSVVEEILPEKRFRWKIMTYVQTLRVLN